MPLPHIISHLEQDSYLKGILPEIQLVPIVPDNDIYKSLLSSIVSQQLSTKVADVIYKRFLVLFEDEHPHPELLISIPVEKLRAVGLSGQKSSYLRNVAQHWLDHNCLERDWIAWDDDAILTDLTKIKGVGKWTVQMILIFRLDRPDIFPVDDLGIQQAIAQLYGLEDTGKVLRSKMEAVSESWRPYRTYACRYLWKWKDGARKK